MQSEIQRQLLMAAATRQGVTITPIEAETLADVLEGYGLSLIIEEDWTIKVHEQRHGREHSADWTSSDIRELVEMAVDLNNEAIVDMTGERDAEPEVLLGLHKDEYILHAMLGKAMRIVPPQLKKYHVGIVINHKIYDDIEAASWTEAESIAQKKWMNGEYGYSDKDFLGIMVTNG